MGRLVKKVESNGVEIYDLEIGTFNGIQEALKKLYDYEEAEEGSGRKLVSSKKRWVFIFYLKGEVCCDEWTVYCFENGGLYKKYFNDAEDDWDDALDYVDLFLENGGNKYYYVIPEPDQGEYLRMSYDEFEKLDDKPIEKLSAFLQKE